MVEGRNHHYSTRRIEMVRMVVVSSFYHHSTRRIETVRDRKSTRLNSSHDQISYAVFCLKKKKKHNYRNRGNYEQLHQLQNDRVSWVRHRETQLLRRAEWSVCGPNADRVLRTYPTRHARS